MFLGSVHGQILSRETKEVEFSTLRAAKLVKILFSFVRLKSEDYLIEVLIVEEKIIYEIQELI